MASFTERLRSALEEVLESLAVDKAKIHEELQSMIDSVFAKTASRQILGSMNDFAHIMKSISDRNMSLKAISDFLGDTPCSPIGMSTPLDETARIFQAEIPKPRKQVYPPLRLIKSGD
jgi:hypothetical protein